jgi:polysaccharide deacetylase 2 family uncharacterized protein YibQ
MVTPAKRKNSSKAGLSVKRKPRPASKPLKNLFGWITVFAAILLIAGALLIRWFPPEKLKPSVAKTDHAKSGLYEIYPAEPQPPPADVIKPPIIHPPSGLPRAAIIFDDMGADIRAAQRLSNLGCPLTFSILPYSSHRMDVIDLAKGSGIGLMAHIPMEPIEYPRIKPGTGALFVRMEPEELVAQLSNDIGDLPDIQGINNHMGSRLTSNPVQMERVLAIIHAKHLFFVDSRTTPNSVARAAAKLLQVPFAQRDVFLDHLVEKGAIRAQVVRFIETAQRNGSAIAIGHPHEETIAVLEEQMATIRKSVILVPVSELVAVPR